MKKIIFMLFSILMLSACVKEHTDYFEDSQNKKIAENVEKVFGAKFSPDQDWTSAVSRKISVSVPAGTERVQVLVLMKNVNDLGEEYTSMTALNETAVNGQETAELVIDEPVGNLGLYIAYISGDRYTVKKLGGSPAAVRTRAAVSYTLPSGSWAINATETPFEAQRGWIPGEILWSAGSASMPVADYDADFKDVFRNMVFSYFPNGRGFNNLPKVKASGYYNESVYPITTGVEPIIVMPVYKMDQAGRYGNEVWNSDLYYYYFKESDLGSDPVGYIESLPKYKALSFNEYFGESEDDVIRRNTGFVLMYFGDGQPSIGTAGSFQFPAGYKIGFMVRAKSTTEGGKKQGEVYGDGRLNNHINSYSKCNFKSSNLGQDGPRAAWLNVNDHLLMCWESGTDCDFNDIIMEVDGGITKIPIIPEDEYNVYTFCYEDTPLGDYDLNDVVIKAVRKNTTTVEYYITACGANDELYIRNLDNSIAGNEVHSLLGTEEKVFINTVRGGRTGTPYKLTRIVDRSFSFLDPNTQPRIYDKTINHEVSVSRKGEDPHGIMIPNDFRYPLEKVRVSDAYTGFNSWGQNPVTSTDWYTKPVAGLVF